MSAALASTFLDSDANKYGINEAIVLFKIRNFLIWAKSQKSKNHCHQGRWWTYNSYAGWKELIPYFSHKQIRYAIQNLIKKGALITGNFNKKKYDKTTWYSVNEESFQAIEVEPHSDAQIGRTYAKNGIAYAKNGKPIPNYTANNTLSLSLSLSNEFESSFGLSLRKKDRERIFKILESRKEFSQSDINDVFMDVFTNKVDTLGKPIYSEVGYLEVCFEKHLQYLKNKKAKESQAVQKTEAIIQKTSKEDIEKQEAESRLSQIEQAFVETFKTKEEQDSIIKKYSERLSKLPADLYKSFQQIGPAVRNYALEQWYCEINAPLSY